MKLISSLALALLLSLGLSASGTACTKKDTIPPTTPTNIAYNLVGNRTDLLFTWDNSSDEGSGIDAYLVRTPDWGRLGDENWIYNGPSTFYYAGTPRTDGMHVFEVKALDKVGNEGEAARIEFEWDTTPYNP